MHAQHFDLGHWHFLYTFSIPNLFCDLAPSTIRKPDINKQSTMNDSKFLDSNDAVLILKAFVLEKLNVYEPCVVDVEVWNPVLFACYQDRPLHFKRIYIDMAAKFRHWVEHGKNLPGHVIERLMVSLEGDEEGFKQYWFLGRMVLYGPNPDESKGSSEEKGDQGGWLLVNDPAPPAINAAPSEDGWEILELAAASDDHCS
jgi:hypothetical protein